MPAARKIHETLSPLFNALFVTSNPIPLKAALQMVGQAAASLGCRWSLRRATNGIASARRWRTPASLPDSCRLVFLGGIGEVGRNMAASSSTAGS